MTRMVTRVKLVLLLFLWMIQRHEGFQWRHHNHDAARQPIPKCTQKTSHKNLVKIAYQPDDNNSHEIKHKHRRPLAFFSLSTPLPLQRISRLWAAQPMNTSAATTNHDDDDELNFANKTANELLEQAEAWRARAKAIREEALAMETALQQTTSKRLEDKQKEVDVIIATLFSSKLTDFRQDQTNIDAFAEKYSGDSSRKKNNVVAGEVKKGFTALTPDPRVVADRIRRGRYNQEQILAVVDRLFELQYPFLELMVKTDAPIVYGNITTPQNRTDVTQFQSYLQALEQAAAILDDGKAAPSEQVYAMSPSSSTPSRSRRTTDSDDGRLEIAIKTRRKELVKVSKIMIDRKMTYELQAAKSTKNFTNLEGILSKAFGIGIKFSSNGNNTNNIDKNQTEVDLSILDNVTTAGTPLVPMWVPAVFLPYIISSNISTVGPAEVETMEKDVFMGSRFFVTSSDKVPGAALFRGNIRDNLGRIIRIGATDDAEEGGVDNTTAVVFAEIQERMQAAGLGDKVQLFMMTDPESEPRMKGTRPAVAAMEADTKPVILALSKALSPDESKMKQRPIQRLFKTWSYPLAFLSTMIYSTSMYSLNPSFFDAVVNKRDLRALVPCIPLALSILFVQTVHEAAHYLVAKRRDLIIGPPVPIPSIHATSLPLFGCITPLRSFPRNRAALLDFALSGPLSAITVSFGLVVFGALLTVRASQLQIARYPVMSVASMKSSFLLGSILSWLAPKTMMLPLAQPVPMHPFFVVGASGLLSNALNLLPIFRLDGGRACFAAVGPRQGAVISVFTLLLLISMVMSGASSTFITWTFLVALLQRRQEIPPRDDVTEVDGKRLALWLLSFLLSVSIVAPFPGFRILNM